jgi:hypothetical protein
VDFVFTSDIDWASEYAIGNLLSIVGQYGIRPTLFTTHDSATIRAAAESGFAEVGIHPNFLPGSTHGDNVDAVIQHVLTPAPNARISRSHSFLDGTHIATALVRHGITTDSNLVCYLQSGLAPLHHWAGLLRLPVFWEDDVHWARGGSWRFAPYAERFLSPGLKILNFHPFLVALIFRVLKPPSLPAWLNRFEGGWPHRKAALIANHREILTCDQAFLTADIILWGGVSRRDEPDLERLFAKILWLAHGVRWADHPLARKGPLK